MAKKKVDCSELAKEVEMLVKNIVFDTGAQTIDDVVKEIHKFPDLQAIRREDIVTLLNEVAESRSRTMSDDLKAMSKIRREVKKNVELSRAIYDYEKGVKREAKESRKKREAEPTPDAILKLQAQKAALEATVGKQKMPTDLSKLARNMARAVVASGVTDRNAVVDAVHKELSEAVPQLTKRQVSDAISGYGQFTHLSKDEIDQKLRDIKGQLQQVAKLEDMAKGIAPAKTGVERRAPSDEERKLIKQVNEEKKKGGFTTTDPETQLRSALDAIKTRLKNQIADLQRQIQERRKDINEKLPAPRDAETVELTKQRDALKKQFDDIFGQQGLTDAQRIANAKKSLEKSIAEYERRLEQKDFTPRSTGTKTPETPELEKLRGVRDRLKDKYERSNPVSPQIIRAQERIRELEGHLAAGTLPGTKPKKETKNPKLKTLQERAADLRKAINESEPALKERYKKTIDDLTRRLEEGDYEAPVKRDEIPQSAELERLQYERDMLRRKIRHRIDAMKPKSVWQHVAEPFNASRAMITSIDFSAVLRQGGFIAVGHPARAAKSLVPMFKAFGSERYTLKMNDQILNRPNAPLYQRAKLYLAPMDGDYRLNKKEEAYMSRWAEKIPLVRGSERAYVSFLNKLRADSFDAMVQTLGRNGEVTQDEAEAIANYINVATGRGNLGSWDSATGPAAQIFFSPRLLASRFQVIFGQPLYRGSGRTRKMVAKEYARFLIGMGIVYALGYWAGGDIEKDPRSSDFGKIKFGNTRMDPLGGISQVTVLLSRLATGELKSANTGKVYQLRGDERKFGMPSTSSVLTNFVRSKLSPIAGTAWNVVAKENVVGENTDITTKQGAAKVATDLMVPLSMRDIYEAMLDQGVPKGTALGILSIFGFGLQSYEPKKSNKKD